MAGALPPPPFFFPRATVSFLSGPVRYPPKAVFTKAVTISMIVDLGCSPSIERYARPLSHEDAADFFYEDCRSTEAAIGGLLCLRR